MFGAKLKTNHVLFVTNMAKRSQKKSTGHVFTGNYSTARTKTGKKTWLTGSLPDRFFLFMRADSLCLCSRQHGQKRRMLPGKAHCKAHGLASAGRSEKTHPGASQAHSALSCQAFKVIVHLLRRGAKLETLVNVILLEVFFGVQRSKGNQAGYVLAFVAVGASGEGL